MIPCLVCGLVLTSLKMGKIEELLNLKEDPPKIKELLSDQEVYPSQSLTMAQPMRGKNYELDKEDN